MNKYLEKVAAKLRKHQEEALNKLEEEGGVIAEHSTGSGKSLLQLEAVRRAQAKDKTGRTLMVAPASLISNFHKEADKHGIKLDFSRIDLKTYEKAVIDAEELKKNKYNLVVSDEAHKLRNTDTKRNKELSQIFMNADRRLLATATSQYNHMADIAPLVNIAAGGKVLPTDRKEMENRYTRTIKNKPTLIQRVLNQDAGEKVKLKNQGELKDVLNKYVHHYDVKDDPENAKEFPTQTEEIVEVPMSKEQTKIYKFLENDIPFLTRMKIRRNLPLSKQEKSNLNAFSSGVRQASSSIRHLHNDPDSVPYTPKVEEAIKSVKERMGKDKNYRGLIYSNYLDAGVHEYSKKLSDEGIDHHVFTGSLKPSEKDQMVKDYNAGKKKVLIISSSGAEGLDLKGTKHVIVGEPHYNPSKIKQVVGRANRFQSHSHLPKEERTVHVQHFLSVHRKPLIGKAPTSIDRYLTDNSDDKSELFNQVKDLMRSN